MSMESFELPELLAEYVQVMNAAADCQSRLLQPTGTYFQRVRLLDKLENHRIMAQGFRGEFERRGLTSGKLAERLAMMQKLETVEARDTLGVPHEEASVGA